MNEQEAESFEKEAISAMLDRKLKADWKNKLQTEVTPKHNLGNAPKKIISMRYWSIAAGFALVLGIAWYLYASQEKPESPQLFALHYLESQPQPTPSTLMGTENPTDLQAAEKAYYDGVKYLWGKPDENDKAIQSFLQVRQLGQGTLHTNDIAFFLALAYSKANNIEAAKAELLKLRNADGTWIFPKAKEFFGVMSDE